MITDYWTKKFPLSVPLCVYFWCFVELAERMNSLGLKSQQRIPSQGFLVS